MSESKSLPVIKVLRSSNIICKDIEKKQAHDWGELNLSQYYSELKKKPDKSPTDYFRINFPINNISHFDPLKTHQKVSKYQNLSKIINKKQSTKGSSIKNIVEPQTRCSFHKSLSPEAIRSLSPLSKTKTQIINCENTQGNITLNNINIKEDLSINQDIIKNKEYLQPGSCIDDIILLGEVDKLTHFVFIDENLRICTRIVRNIICRMKELGHLNEIALIDKLWKHIVKTLDTTIDNLMATQKNKIDEILSTNKKAIKTETNIPKVSENNRAEYIFDSEDKDDCFEIFMTCDFKKLLEKINKEIDTLSLLYSTPRVVEIEKIKSEKYDYGYSRKSRIKKKIENN